MVSKYSSEWKDFGNLEGDLEKIGNGYRGHYNFNSTKFVVQLSLTSMCMLLPGRMHWGKQPTNFLLRVTIIQCPYRVHFEYTINKITITKYYKYITTHQNYCISNTVGIIKLQLFFIYNHSFLVSRFNKTCDNYLIRT